MIKVPNPLPNLGTVEKNARLLKAAEEADPALRKAKIAAEVARLKAAREQ